MIRYEFFERGHWEHGDWVDPLTEKLKELDKDQIISTSFNQVSGCGGSVTIIMLVYEDEQKESPVKIFPAGQSFICFKCKHENEINMDNIDKSGTYFMTCEECGEANSVGMII